jgi:hypothetical protein
MADALKIVGILAALCVGAVTVDYGCYYQATIFTTLDGSGKGMDAQHRDPPYHPFVHPVLWLIAAAALLPLFLMLALNISSELSAYIFAGALGAYLVARYILMRRGIS